MDFKIASREEDIRGVIVDQVVEVPVGPSVPARIMQLARERVRPGAKYPSDFRDYGAKKFDPRNPK